jgi:hypothetical protein
MDVSTKWYYDNTAGIYISWCLTSGATFQTAAGAWTAGNFMASANQFNLFGTNGNVFELFDVGLYEGDVAPPFMVPDYASELLACQRYYEHVTIVFGWDHALTAGYGLSVPGYFLTKRALPTLTVLSGALGTGWNYSGVNVSTPNSYDFDISPIAAGPTGRGVAKYTYKVSARL